MSHVNESCRTYTHTHLGMSISSFEHDGLGRYGDPVNAFGDFEAMTEMESIITEGGLWLYIYIHIYL